eukprot:2107094-Pleurochrysis_carterae.AAC.1
MFVLARTEDRCYLAQAQGESASEKGKERGGKEERERGGERGNQLAGEGGGTERQREGERERERVRDTSVESRGWFNRVSACLRERASASGRSRPDPSNLAGVHCRGRAAGPLQRPAPPCGAYRMPARASAPAPLTSRQRRARHCVSRRDESARSAARGAAPAVCALRAGRVRSRRRLCRRLVW